MDQEIIASRFIVGNKIGSGSFGEVYQAKDQQTGEDIALKIEMYDGESYSQLTHESKIIQQFQGQEGFPNLYWFGQDSKQRPVLAMDLLSKNLEDLFQICNKKLSIKSTLMIIDQMLKRIEQLHTKGLLYRDIKPENFMIGKGKGSGIIYLIDFGLVKQYKDKKSGLHIVYRDNKGLIGTARYVSINTHLGIEQSRRDDLESLAYVWIYLLKGRLPWQGIVCETKEEKYEKLKLKKIATSIDVLCEGLPKEFSTYLTYCRQLKFEEQPDYYYLKQLFKELFFKLEYNWDFIFDWMEINQNSSNTSPGEQRNLSEQSQDQELKCQYKRGSTTYESQKEEDKQQISQIKQITQQQQQNSNIQNTLGQDGNQQQQQISSIFGNTVQNSKPVDFINFKLTTPDKKPTKPTLKEFKVNPSLFANLFNNNCPSTSSSSISNNNVNNNQTILQCIKTSY